MKKIDHSILSVAKGFNKLTKYDFSSFSEDVDEKSRHYKLFDVTINNRNINFSDNETDYLHFEGKFITILVNLLEKYLITELVFPPVKSFRNMRLPGIYQFENRTELEACIKEGLREIDYIQLFIPELGIFIETGNDFYARFFNFKDKEPDIKKINEIKEQFLAEGFKLI
jgi:hypothetical protein